MIPPTLWKAATSTAIGSLHSLVYSIYFLDLPSLRCRDSKLSGHPQAPQIHKLTCFYSMLIKGKATRGSFSAFCHLWAFPLLIPVYFKSTRAQRCFLAFPFRGLSIHSSTKPPFGAALHSVQEEATLLQLCLQCVGCELQSTKCAELWARHVSCQEETVRLHARFRSLMRFLLQVSSFLKIFYIFFLSQNWPPTRGFMSLWPVCHDLKT